MRALIVLGTLAGIGSCTCSSQGLNAQSALFVDTSPQPPDTLDFGTVHVGQKKSLSATIQNVGLADIVPVLGALSPGSAFTVVPAQNFPPLPSSTGTRIVVTFAPTRATQYAETLTVGCSGCDDSAVALLGNSGGDCTLTIAPPSLTFPLLQPGQQKLLASVISNTGGAACTVAIKLDSASDPAFTLGGGASTVKLAAAGPGSKVTVTFAAPSAQGGHHGTVLVDSNDPKRPHQKILLNASNEDAGYADTPWPKWHRTSGNSGLSTVDTSRTTGQLAWKHAIGAVPSLVDPQATYLASPVIGLEGVIYQLGFGTSLNAQGSFVALHPDGTEKWRIAITSPEPTCAESTPTVAADGSVYLMTGGDAVSQPLGFSGEEFFHLAAGDGHTLWSTHNLGDGYDSSPALSPDGTLYVINDDTQDIEAYKNDQLKWTGTVSLAHPETFSGALTADGTSFWSAQGEVSSLTANGAQERWHVTLGGAAGGHHHHSRESKASPALAADGTVYVAEVGASGAASNPQELTVFALDPTTGNTKWSAKGSGSGTLSPSGYSSPAMMPDGSVVVGSAAGMHAFASGAEVWHFPCGGVVSSPAVGADGSVYFGSTDGNLYAVDAGGKLRWKLAIGAAVNSAPAIGGDGTVYAMADDGYLYAVR